MISCQHWIHAMKQYVNDLTSGHPQRQAAMHLSKTVSSSPTLQYQTAEGHICRPSHCPGTGNPDAYVANDMLRSKSPEPCKWCTSMHTSTKPAKGVAPLTNVAKRSPLSRVPTFRRNPLCGKAFIVIGQNSSIAEIASQEATIHAWTT